MAKPTFTQVITGNHGRFSKFSNSEAGSIVSNDKCKDKKKKKYEDSKNVKKVDGDESKAY